MEKKPIITWLDAMKLAIGIMIGLTSTLLIIIEISDNDSTPKTSEMNDHDTIYDESYYNEYYAIPSVEDCLNRREELRYALWVDSVYLAMPEDVLIRILVNKGTQVSVNEIVKEYVKNKEQYHGNK